MMNLKQMKYPLLEKLEAISINYYKIIICLFVLFGIAALYFILPNFGMGPVWSVPYFSGSVNSNLTGTWNFAPSDVQILKHLKGLSIYFYEFEKAKDINDLQSYGFNTTGLLYIIKFAHFLFPFLGQIGSLVLFQLITHAIITYLFMSKFKSHFTRLLFLALYGINPFILYEVTMPFYYYWAVLASVGGLLIFLEPKAPTIKIILFFFLIIIAYFIRPTTLPVAMFCIVFIGIRKRFFTALLLIIVFGVTIYGYNSFFNKTINYGPWHTAFVGIGAYPNPYPYLYNLSDDRGYDRYKAITGKSMNSSIKGNYYQKNDRDEYMSVMKDEYFRILKENPFLIIRNIGINVLQLFSFGHLANRGFGINIFVAICGLIFLIFLFCKRKIWPILFILSTGIGVVALFPPIQAYMFSTYICLVFIFLDAIRNEKSLSNQKTRTAFL